MELSVQRREFSDFVYVVEKAGFGHIICVLKHFTPKKYRHRYGNIVAYMTEICAEALAISRRHGNSTVFTHIYLTDCSLRNFSIKLGKEITRQLYSVFSDTLETGYIYSKSQLFAIMLSLLKTFILPETMVKFRHIKVRDS